MDPSAPAAQNVQDQTPAAQPVTDMSSDQNATQQAGPNSNTPAPTQPVQPKPAPIQKTQISVSGSGGLESGSAVIAAEDPDDDDDEDELQVAPQEKKNLGVMGQGSDDLQEDEQQIVSQPAVVDVEEVGPELQPAVPEVIAASPEVEKLIEVNELEKPKISTELKNIGVTHSGPGIIDAADMHLSKPKIPVTYAQAITQEELIKANRLHSSKFWLLEKIKYLWRKMNPDIAMTVMKPVSKGAIANKLPVKTVPVKTVPVKTASVNLSQLTASKVPPTEKVAA